MSASHRTTKAGVLFLAAVLTLVACGSGGRNMASTADSPPASPLEPVAIAQAQASPDGRTLNLLVNGCSAGGTATVTETDDRVTVDARSHPRPLPCTTEVLVVLLDQPLGARSVVNARDGALIHSYTADPPTAPTAPPSPPADCSTDSIRASVEREIDGGLRTRTLGCGTAWMVVDTSTDACPASDEPTHSRCVANHHVVYFENVDQVWRVAAFDNCERLRKYKDFPPELCDPRS
jgi:hypothetical protein